MGDLRSIKLIVMLPQNWGPGGGSAGILDQITDRTALGDRGRGMRAPTINESPNIFDHVHGLQICGNVMVITAFIKPAIIPDRLPRIIRNHRVGQ
jgi:hypothetical protein